ncbi:hypothetical protein JOL62DRAFT_349194 [Phyllosticta paracitricarpa]|uniref:Uncharacterized protein n=1 Tax=Phyllosticta paracitricarpa TaxID=2016321 RepID=A0ABR1NI14_9PEZI
MLQLQLQLLSFSSTTWAWLLRLPKEGLECPTRRALHRQPRFLRDRAMLHQTAILTPSLKSSVAASATPRPQLEPFITEHAQKARPYLGSLSRYPHNTEAPSGALRLKTGLERLKARNKMRPTSPSLVVSSPSSKGSFNSRPFSKARGWAPPSIKPASSMLRTCTAPCSCSGERMLLKLGCDGGRLLLERGCAISTCQFSGPPHSRQCEQQSNGVHNQERGT